MLRHAAKLIALRLVTPKQRPPYEEVWHLWTVIVPRRSITGRLLRGAVLRRQHDGRWIYKKYIEIVHGAEFAAAARIPVGEPALAADRATVLAGEGAEPLVGQWTGNAPLPSLTRAQKTAALAILGVLILLPAAIEYRHLQTGAPTAECGHDKHCDLPGAPAPAPESHLNQSGTKNSVVTARQPPLDSNGNESGLVKSKTGASARV